MDVYSYPVAYSVVVTYDYRGEPRQDRVAYHLTLDEAQAVAESFRNHRQPYLAVGVVAHPAIPYVVYAAHKPAGE